MLTMEDVIKVQDPDLKCLLIKFNSIHSFTDKDFYKIIPQNTTDEAIIIRKDLSNFICKKIINHDMINALNIPNELKYHKKKEIAINLLENNDTDFYPLINSILWMPEGHCPTDSLIQFLLDQDIFIDKNILTGIRDFVTDSSNKHIINTSKSIYLPEQDEKKLLLEALFYRDCRLFGIPDNFRKYYEDQSWGMEFKDYGDAKEWEDTLLSWYIAKRVGNIAEYYYQKKLDTSILNSCHVSRFYGDGFGYDHIGLFPMEEKLYETKGTIYEANRDSIKITNNEYNVMLDCLGLIHSNYYVPRIFMDRKDISYKDIYLLEPRDEKTLVAHRKNGITYKYDHEDEKGKIFIKQ